jgi:hypothetical protein
MPCKWVWCEFLSPCVFCTCVLCDIFVIVRLCSIVLVLFEIYWFSRIVLVFPRLSLLLSVVFCLLCKVFCFLMWLTVPLLFWVLNNNAVAGSLPRFHKYIVLVPEEIAQFIFVSTLLFSFSGFLIPNRKYL